MTDLAGVDNVFICVVQYDDYLATVAYGPKWSTNSIAITRIFPHWPMDFTL